VTDHTPTTEEVKFLWTERYSPEGFDRWLAFVKDMAYWEGYGDGQDSERGFN